MAGAVAGDRLAELLDEHRPFRTRSDHAHVPLEHIEELRQFIHAGLAQECAEPCAAWIVLHGPHGARLFLRIDAQAAELEHPKRLAIEPASLLPVQNRARTRKLDDNGDYHHERRKHHEGEYG